MKRLTTTREKLAVIKAVLRVNAALLGERQDVFATPLPKGQIRVGLHRGEAKAYPDIDTALSAAFVALDNAKTASGLSFAWPPATRPATSWPQDSDLARALGNGTASLDADPAASWSPVEDPSPRRATPRRATG